ncbi:MAG: tRNA 5-methoxyuridine(34)/uridine 5-oxyacetic acid(34) synthase CmoB [Pirellulaceae bacterium]
MSPLLDRTPLQRSLESLGQSGWAKQVAELCAQRFKEQSHGTLPKWMAAWNALPEAKRVSWQLNEPSVALRGELSAEQLKKLPATLMEFHPWRKGPFDLFGIHIDTEWRSDLKWVRLAPHIDFAGKNILDIGCGNGYYGWKMLGAGASNVVGCDPTLLYVLQYEVLAKFASNEDRSRHSIIPCTDEELPNDLACFDLAFSMGVLYHRTSPIDHLKKVHSTLKRHGKIVLETLVIDDTEETVLVPKSRYAKMRNTWFIPSVPMLRLWLQRTGFDSVTVLDESPTTTEEQRRTDWMTFESLGDFLDPNDPTRTVEGYPGPRRAILSARKAN